MLLETNTALCKIIKLKYYLLTMYSDLRFKVHLQTLFFKLKTPFLQNTPGRLLKNIHLAFSTSFLIKHQEDC